MKKSFELVEYEGQMILVMDDEAFDWGLDYSDVQKVKLAVKKDQGVKESFVGNIKNHFITCLGEFLGKPTSFAEINESLERGYIEC